MVSTTYISIWKQIPTTRAAFLMVSTEHPLILSSLTLVNVSSTFAYCYHSVNVISCVVYPVFHPVNKFLQEEPF